MTLRNGNSLYILVLFGEAIGTAAVSLVPVPIEVTVRTGTVSLFLFHSRKLSGQVFLVPFEEAIWNSISCSFRGSYLERYFLFLSRKLSGTVFLVPFEEAI